MRGLIATSLADARLGLLILVLAALLAGCAETVSHPDVWAAEPRVHATCPCGPVLPEGWHDPIHFDTDKAEIRADAMPVIKRVVEIFRGFPSAQIQIEGFADERGTREYNLALGNRRAEAYRSALIAAGMPASRIAGSVSYGKERPAVAGSTETAWAANRRAVVEIH